MRWWFAVALGAMVVVAAGWWISGGKPSQDRRVVRVAVSPSGRLRATGTASGEVTVVTHGAWVVAGGVLNDLQFGPGDEALGIASRDLWVWRFGRGEAPRKLRADGANYGMAEFDSEGASVLTVTGEGRIERIDVVTGRTLWSVCCTSIYGDVRFAPGGRVVVNAGHRPGLRDAATGARLADFEIERSAPAYGPIAFDRTRGHVWIGSQDGSVLCRDLATQAVVEGPPRQRGWVEGIAFSGDGARAALLVSGIGVRIWERATGAVRTVEASVSSNVVADGERFVYARKDGRID